jgi:succinylarginine dihydrolase
MCNGGGPACLRLRVVLTPADLADPKFLQETRRALAALTTLLGLGPIYPFQLSA